MATVTKTHVRATWSSVLRDLARIAEWAERFPNEGTDEALAWADAEICRIGEYLDILPAQNRLAHPDAGEFAKAMNVAELG